MSLLFVGGEDIDFPLGGNPVSVGTTSGTHYRAGGYARCGVRSVGGALSNPFAAGAVTSCWLTFRILFKRGASGSPVLSAFFAGVVNGSTGTKGIWVGGGASTFGKLAIFKYDGTTKTALATTANSIFSTDAVTERKIDLQIISYGASSTIHLYINGGIVATFTGDCTVSGVTDLDSVGIDNSEAPSNGASLGMSEFIVATEDTRAFSLLTMAPTSDGTTTDWTGAYTDIDETTLDDADAAYTDTVTQDQQFNATDAPSGVFSVPYVTVVARAAKSGGATATKVGLGVNHGGTVDAGTLQSVTTAWDRYERIMSTNPVTTNPWTTSDLTSLQINLRSGS